MKLAEKINRLKFALSDASEALSCAAEMGDFDGVHKYADQCARYKMALTWAETTPTGRRPYFMHGVRAFYVRAIHNNKAHGHRLAVLLNRTGLKW